MYIKADEYIDEPTPPNHSTDELPSNHGAADLIDSPAYHELTDSFGLCTLYDTVPM